MTVLSAHGAATQISASRGRVNKVNKISLARKACRKPQTARHSDKRIFGTRGTDNGVEDDKEARDENEPVDDARVCGSDDGAGVHESPGLVGRPGHDGGGQEGRPW